jgi:hypothetical protein
MSIFTTILDKLGLHKPAKPAAPAATPKPAPYSPISSPVVPSTPPSAHPAAPVVSPIHFGPPAQAAAPAPIAMVDVSSHLDKLAKASPIELNWKQSINDLLALLGMPHTPQAIKDLAIELGCPEKEMADSYSRNVWTHKELLRKIAENGGNIPQNLLD